MFLVTPSFTELYSFVGCKGKSRAGDEERLLEGGVTGTGEGDGAGTSSCLTSKLGHRFLKVMITIQSSLSFFFADGLTNGTGKIRM